MNTLILLAAPLKDILDKVGSHPLAVLDNVRLNFTEGSLLTMNIVIAFVMFGVALNIDLKEFKSIWKHPKPFWLGACSQFVFLPLLTFLLVKILNPTPSVALGMILVAACPGGNVSNFISLMSKANVSLSVSLTAFSTIACVVLTPFNFWLYGTLYFSSVDVPFVHINFIDMLQTVVLLLGLPVALGIFVGKRFPIFVKKIKKPMSYLSIIVFIAFVIMALKNNFDYFLKYIHLIFLLVLVHNALAFLTGYLTGKFGKLSDANVRTLSIETGIQNSGLGLILIFNPKLFDGLGGMAFITAFWGIWHIVAGMGLAALWSRKKMKE
ncbi:MAG: bile acid:sodium symporter family protein [Candidatus Symbiothrix sp.]|jgi:BASS family bile acid:Na+ symporter|nr:bile acid:sodium symporter family protein [Candidatus Symbiothrix sp.]